MVCSLLFVAVSLQVQAVHCVMYGKGGVYVHLHLVLSDSAFFTITIVAKAIFPIFDSITIVHFSLINEI